tara:strand:- start:363 stop:518 length:156 start_codon:yes stop_codon:yes gene_type:complete
MGINLSILTVIVFFSLLFLFAFIYSSMNIDSKGVMDWMMAKPKDWIGNQKK